MPYARCFRLLGLPDRRRLLSICLKAALLLLFLWLFACLPTIRQAQGRALPAEPQYGLLTNEAVPGNSGQTLAFVAGETLARASGAQARELPESGEPAPSHDSGSMLEKRKSACMPERYNALSRGCAWLRFFIASHRLVGFGRHCNLPVVPEARDSAWDELVERLVADDFDRQEIEMLFSRLGPDSYSPAFMAAKITELYNVPGIGIKRDNVPAPESPPGYIRPVSDITVGSCLAYLQEHKEILDSIEKTLAVKSDVILAILLVETGLGHELGRDIALRAIGSMAATNTPERLGSKGNSAQRKRVRPAALAATLTEKSEWAYTELKALLRYAKSNGLDASRLPGSIYGAVGLCQFMPSNIALLGVDGDGDGVIDLFTPVDAMHSVANYLANSGWGGATTTPRRHAVLRTYNNDGIYVAVVLGTADIINKAIKGKVSAKLNALAGGGHVVPSARLDPSLRRLRPVPRSARVQSLGDYKSLLQ